MERKLRIAMFMSSNPARAGGIQTHVSELAQRLVSRGHAITVFGIDEKPKLIYPNYRSVATTTPAPTFYGHWGIITFSIALKKPLVDTMTDGHFDILHIHDPFVPFVAWQLLLGINLPKVVTFHAGWDDQSGVNVVNPILPLFQSIFSKHVQGAIFVSDITKRRWAPMCGSSVIHKTIPNGVNHALFYSIEKEPSTSIELLYAARLVPRKGLQYLLDALRSMDALVRTSLHLTVIGDGEQRRYLETYVRHHRLAPMVTFAGEVFGDRRAPYFQRADIFCAPYADEAFPVTYLEAMACGCPIVGFANESIRSIFRTYPAPDLFVSQYNGEMLRTAIERLMKNVRLRAQLRTWCMHESLRYSWEKTAEVTERLYLDVLAKRA